MGVDFIRERAQAFTRSWDKHRVDLATRSLFTVDPACLPRAAIARTRANAPAVAPGKVLVIRYERGRLVAYDELTPVAEFVEPPPELLSAVQECGGYANGEVIEVYSPGVLEIAI